MILEKFLKLNEWLFFFTGHMLIVIQLLTLFCIKKPLYDSLQWNYKSIGLNFFLFFAKICQKCLIPLKAKLTIQHSRNIFPIRLFLSLSKSSFTWHLIYQPSLPCFLGPSSCFSSQSGYALSFIAQMSCALVIAFFLITVFKPSKVSDCLIRKPKLLW